MGGEEGRVDFACVGAACAGACVGGFALEHGHLLLVKTALSFGGLVMRSSMYCSASCSSRPFGSTN